MGVGVWSRALVTTTRPPTIRRRGCGDAIRCRRGIGSRQASDPSAPVLHPVAPDAMGCCGREATASSESAPESTSFPWFLAWLRRPVMVTRVRRRSGGRVRGVRRAASRAGEGRDDGRCTRATAGRSRSQARPRLPALGMWVKVRYKTPGLRGVRSPAHRARYHQEISIIPATPRRAGDTRRHRATQADPGSPPRTGHPGRSRSARTSPRRTA